MGGLPVQEAGQVVQRLVGQSEDRLADGDGTRESGDPHSRPVRKAGEDVAGSRGCGRQRPGPRPI